MPYEWLPASPNEHRLRAWPYRSLPATGFVWFIGLTSALLSIPLLAVLGSVILWGILPFIVAVIAAVWFALRRNFRDRDILEELSLTTDQTTLVRCNPDHSEQRWQANSHWVRVALYPTGAKVTEYLTLSGDGREVELGAFLTPSERKALANDVRLKLAELRGKTAP
ncbi:MAG: DUF2244 domain-containing protein [Paracoccaceae bacterium]|jgi:uncharacterized membrane protein